MNWMDSQYWALLPLKQSRRSRMPEALFCIFPCPQQQSSSWHYGILAPVLVLSTNPKFGIPKICMSFGFTNTSNHISERGKKKKSSWNRKRRISRQHFTDRCLTERKLDGIKGFKGDQYSMTAGQLPCECCTLLSDKELHLRSVKWLWKTVLHTFFP